MFLTWIETCCLIACVKEVSKVSLKRNLYVQMHMQQLISLIKYPKGAKDNKQFRVCLSIETVAHAVLPSLVSTFPFALAPRPHTSSSAIHIQAFSVLVLSL